MQALYEHATVHEIREIEQTPFGNRYVVEGRITSPDGRTPMIRSIWFVESGDVILRLVTAYPA
jgi:hypothetical protein